MKNLDFELLTDEFMLQTIGFSNLNKLLFTSAHLKKRCHCETSAHTGRGNPPDFPPSPHPSTQAVILSERSESKDLRTERS